MITIQRCVALAVAAAFLISACGGSGGKSSTFCKQLKDFRAKYVNTGGDLTQKQVESASAEFQTIAKNAPKSLKDAAASVSDGFDMYAEGKNAPAYRSEEISAASKKVDTYAEKTCGIDLTTPTTKSAK